MPSAKWRALSVHLTVFEDLDGNVSISVVARHGNTDHWGWIEAKQVDYFEHKKKSWSEAWVLNTFEIILWENEILHKKYVTGSTFFHIKSIIYELEIKAPLQWRHNERDGVSNHRHHNCLPNRLFRRRSKKLSKCVTGLCEGNPPVTGGIP